MSNSQAAWVDVGLCSGCGVCVDKCPLGAIAVVDGVAHVDGEKCTGCLVCVDDCPEGAILPEAHGQMVAVQNPPAPVVRPSQPLAETVGVAAAAVSVGMLARVGGALARALGRWVSQELIGGRGAPSATSIGRRALLPFVDSRADRRWVRFPRRAGRRKLGFRSAGNAECSSRASTFPGVDAGEAGARRQSRRRHRGG
jgi:ferredoxin